jgi:hypothetical protein
MALAAVNILRADMHPDWRTSAWGSWSTMVALGKDQMESGIIEMTYTWGIKEAVYN